MSDRSPLLSALTLRQVQYFVTVAQLGSFTQAAHVLSVSQPALTAAIRQIERLLGGSLFERLPQGLKLSQAGGEVLPLAERLVNTARGILEDMASTVAEHTQTVRIGLIPSVAARLLPALSALKRAEPSLRFSLTDLPNNLLLDAIRRGDVDFGLGAHEPGQAPAGLECRALFEDELVAVMRADDALAGDGSLTWTQLAARELAVFVRGNVSEALALTGSRHGLNLQPSYRMEYTEPLYALVRQALAVAVMPQLYTLHLHDPALRVVPLHQPRVARTVALISLPGVARSQQAQRCQDWVALRI